MSNNTPPTDHSKAQTMEVTAQNRRSPRCPALPLEVWDLIMCNITDSHYLPRVWLNCRRVSRILKAATEYAFTSAHLRHTEISFTPRMWVKDNEDYIVDLRVKVAFDRLSDDRTRAIFVLQEPKPDPIDDWTRKAKVPGTEDEEDTLYNMFMGLWKKVITPYIGNSPERHMQPNHVLKVRGLVNDTELVGVEVDLERKEVSVLWKPMLSLFFGEDEYRKWATKVRRQHKQLEDDPRRDIAFRAKLLKQEETLGMMLYPGQLEDYADVGVSYPILHTIQRVVRRLRFRRILNKLEANGIADAKQHDWLRVNTGLTKYVIDKSLDLRPSVQFGNDEFDDTIEEDVLWPAREPGPWKETRWGCFYDGMHMTFEGKGETNEAIEDLGIEVHWQDKNGYRYVRW